MFETVNVKARLTTIIVSAGPANEPVAIHSRIRSAPRIPKIAPEAPTVGEFGVRISAPAEPASPEAR